MTLNNTRRRSLITGPPILSKIVVSALIGVLGFLVGTGLDSNMGNDVLVGIGVSVFVSGIAFITQFLVDTDHQLNELATRVSELTEMYSAHANATEQLIQGEYLKINAEFTKINAATKLFGAVEASALKTDAMTQLVQHSTSIAVDSPPLIFNFAQAEITRLSGYLRELGQRADVYYEGEDRDWLLGLTRAASRSIDATSLTTVDAGGRGFVDGGLYISDLGRRYLEAQKEAIRRGVVIRRLFILDRLDLPHNPELVEVLKEQLEAGVLVALLDPRRVPPNRRASLIDFIVIDDVLVYRSAVTARVELTSHPIIESTRLISEASQVRDRIARFAELWQLGEKYQAPPELPPAVGDEGVVDPVD